MESLQTLIDEAAQVCSSYAALARRLGTTPQRVHQWKTGERAMTPETVADLCNVLECPGERARELAAVAVIENAKNATRRAALVRAFFARLVLGVAVALQPVGPAVKIGTEQSIHRRVLRWLAAELLQRRAKAPNTGDAFGPGPMASPRSRLRKLRGLRPSGNGPYRGPPTPPAENGRREPRAHF